MLTILQLFVFLFAPIVDRVKEGDLCFRLEGGKRLWRPLWNFEQPNIPCFAALVKPRKSIGLFTEDDSPFGTQFVRQSVRLSNFALFLQHFRLIPQREKCVDL